MHPFEPRFVRIHAPDYSDGHPLPVVGTVNLHIKIKSNLFVDPALEDVFSDLTSGKFVPARVEDTLALIRSYGEYATRKCDLDLLTGNMPAIVKTTVSLLPQVSDCLLDPQETIAMSHGEKAAGFICEGTKQKFHEKFMVEMYGALSDNCALIETTPINVQLPKNELRDFVKDPRDLVLPPVWFNNLAVQYEKLFSVQSQQLWFDSPIAIGIPMPQAWPLIIAGLVKYLVSPAVTLYFMWDAKKFDRTHPIDITITWYDFLILVGAVRSIGDATREYILFFSSVRVTVMPDGKLRVAFAGIGSGDASTSFKNSVFHIMRLAACWIRVFGTLKGFRTFMLRCGIRIFGDDALCAAHTPMHVFFLRNMATAWEAVFGAGLVMSESPYISEGTFLGKRALGDDPLTRVMPVSSDLDRQLSSLIKKNKKQIVPLKKLSKLVSHRFLLCGFSLTPTEVSPKTAALNAIGREALLRLDVYTRSFIADFSELFAENVDFTKTAYFALIDAQHLARLMMSGDDLLVPEAVQNYLSTIV